MWNCVGVPNFIQIVPSAADLWRHSDFQDGGHRVANLFPVTVWWRITLKGVKMYLHTKFRQCSSIRGRDITISGFWNKRTPYWNSTSGFHLDVSVVIDMWFCVGVRNFIQIRPSAAELWRHSDFQDGGHQPYWIFFRVMVTHPRSASGGLCFIFKFGLDRIYSLGDSAIFRFLCIGMNLPIHAHF